MRVPCALSCCPATPGNKTLVWTVDVSYSSFDCPAWVALLATAMNVPAAGLRLCSLQSGSALVGVAASDAQQDQIVAAAASGSVNIPGATQVLDTSNGRTSKRRFYALVILFLSRPFFSDAAAALSVADCNCCHPRWHRRYVLSSFGVHFVPSSHAPHK